MGRRERCISGGSCQKYHFSCDEFVVTNMFFCNNVFHDKNTSFVMTKVCLLPQNFCHDKHNFVMTNICYNKSFVTTRILLS